MYDCVNNILPLIYNEGITVEEQIHKITDFINTHIQNYKELETKYQALLEYVKKLEESGFLQVQANWNEQNANNPAYIQNKPYIPPEQVQANWNESDVASKSFIQNKPLIPDEQVQANWNETNKDSKSFIQNKPSIPKNPVQANWNENDVESLAFIQNKPTIPAEQVQANWNENDVESLAFIQNKPTIPAEQVQANWNENDVESLAFIQNKPTIPAEQVQANWNETDTESKSFIQNKPTIPAEQVQADWLNDNPLSKAFIINKPLIPQSPIQSDWLDTNPSSLAYIKNKPETAFFEQIQSDWNEINSDKKSYILNKPSIMPNNIAANFDDLLQAETGYWYIVDKTCKNLPVIATTDDFNEISIYKSGTTYLCIAKGDVSKFFVGYVNKSGEVYSIKWQDMSGITEVNWNSILNKPNYFPFMLNFKSGSVKNMKSGYGYIISMNDLANVTDRPVEHTSGGAITIVGEYPLGQKLYLYYMYISHKLMIGTMSTSGVISWNYAQCEDYDKYYKAGDVYKPLQINTGFTGFLTGNRLYMHITVDLPKSIRNINKITITLEKYQVRNNGVYIYKDGELQNGATIKSITCYKADDFKVLVTFIMNTAVDNSVNNFPVVSNGGFTLKFS